MVKTFFVLHGKVMTGFKHVLKNQLVKMSYKKSCSKQFSNINRKILLLEFYKPEIPSQIFSCEICEVFKILYFKSTSVNDCFWNFWFKLEEIMEKNRDVSRDDNRICIQDPVKNLRWSFLQKQNLPLIFSNTFIST